jgi:hypothetical protein
MTNDLTHHEQFLLKWLSGEDFSQYGECHGKALDGLIAKGLAQIHGPHEHQSGFIAKEPHDTQSLMYRAVSLTDAGIAKAKELPASIKGDLKT